MLLDLANDVGNVDKKFHTDPCFFMLYNDYFSGPFDYTVKKDGTKKYKESSKKLSKFVNDKQFGYIFKQQKMLCDVMSIKYDLGVRTRNAYQNNKEELKVIIKDYKKLLNLLNDFSSFSSELWIKEHKTAGLEINNIHLGGLLERTKTCIALLNKLLLDNLNICELEEENLPFYCGEVPSDEPVCSAQYELSASVNELTH